MPHDPSMRVDEQTTSESGAVVADEPLRIDEQGNPVYAAWDEDYRVEDEPEGVEEPEDRSYDGSAEEQSPAARPGEIEVSYEQSPDQVRASVQRNWDDFRRRMAERHFDTEALLDGVEKSFSTSEATAFFGRSTQWMYWGLRKDPETGEQVFAYKNGDPILPERVGKMGKRRFTLPLIREIALSCYRRGNLTEEELQDIFAKILVAEFGEKAFDTG